MHPSRMRNLTSMPTRARAVLRALALLIRLPGRLLINALDGAKARNGVGPLNRFQRGAVHGFVWLCALIMFSMMTTPATPTATTWADDNDGYPPAATLTAAAAPPSMSTSDQGPAAPDGERAMVATVTDGDTFQLTDGRKVRVLGIDSCEDTGNKKTPGGAQATAAALILDGQEVILTAEPGVDVDHWGQLLRYVWTDETGDFGLYMVGYDHTGIYDPANNDASQAYLDQLYAHDLDYAANPPSGRDCGEYPPPAPAPNDDDAYVPLPDNDDDRDRGGRFCGRWNPIC